MALRLTILIVMTILVPSPASAEDTLSKSNALDPLSRAELIAAIEKHEPIIGRTIRGEDIIAVLGPLITSEKTCDNHRGLRIEKGTISGDITVTSRVPNNTPPALDDSANEDTGEEPSETSQDPANWLAIPITIKASAATGRVDFSNIGFACPTDFSDTTFEDKVDIRDATFAGDLAAVRSIFKAGISLLGVDFRSSVVFRRAKFMGNVESIPDRTLRTTFRKDVDFYEAVFNRVASFLGTSFLGPMDFRYVQFMNGASFSNSKLGSGPRRSFSGPFYMAEFFGQGTFRHARFTSLKFLRTAFRNGVDFNRSRGRTLQFLGVTLTGPANFDDAHIRQVDFNAFGGSMVVDGDAIFRRANSEKLTFNRVTFKKSVDLEEAKVTSKLEFRVVSFDGDVHLEDFQLQEAADASGGESEDEKRAAFKINDITLNKGLYMSPQQFFSNGPWWAVWAEESPRFEASGDGVDRRLWRELKRAFAMAGNIELKNYADYRVRHAEENDLREPARAISVGSRLFWGYGLRPLRVLFWFTVFLLAFAAIYWSQMAAVGAGQTRISRMWLRAKQSLVFSWRTAWEFKFGYQNSLTPTFHTITLLQSVMAKVLLACLVYSMTQGSPLLSELLKKLLP